MHSGGIKAVLDLHIKNLDKNLSRIIQVYQSYNSGVAVNDLWDLSEPSVFLISMFYEFSY